MGVVYKFRHRESDKIYIGQTTKPFHRRVRGHFSADSYFGNALRKYGLLSFEITILACSDSRRELNRLEALYVLENNSLHPNGYNLTSGGDCAKPSKLTLLHLRNSWKNISSEEREKRLKGFIWDDERRKLTSIRLLGNKYSLGKKHSSAWKRKMSAQMKIRVITWGAKISAVKKGVPKSEEHKEKLRQISLYMSQATKDKISAAGRGRNCFEQTRQKMVRSQMARRRLERLAA